MRGRQMIPSKQYLPSSSLRGYESSTLLVAMAPEIKKQPYVCVCVYEAKSNAPDFSALYEERLVLLSAMSEEEARGKAQQLLGKEAHEYVNVEGASVIWTCKCIVDVALVVDESFDDGAEIYGRYFRDFDAYEKFEPRLKGKTL